MCDPRVIFRFAGSFVVLSVLLGVTVHPYFFGFTAFVGLNLFQLSFTGWCPLERILGHFRVLGCTPAPRRS